MAQPEIIDLTGSDPIDNSDLFVVDIPSFTVPDISTPTAPEKNKEDDEPKLLLPAHVSVLGSVPVEIIAPASEDQDYVEYLDYGGGTDERAGIARYFHVEPEKSTAPSVIVCKRCGAKGDHKASNCPVIICLTCGVRNEHSTLSCPISKVCFSCGMKGHLNATCPNRGKRTNTYDDCERCGSDAHATNECPTLWRMYVYVTDEERIKTLESRKAKKAFPIGQGGEGYIAEDSWCYNCGDCGHWGDDCETMPHVHDIPNEYSAFSQHNLLSGPFSDVESGTTTREPREWEVDSPQWQDWGGRVPTNVGRQAKKKEMARMRARQEEDDEEDGFARLAKSRPARDNGNENGNGRRAADPGNGQKLPTGPKKMRIELSVKGAASGGLSVKGAASKTIGLIERLDDGPENGFGRSKDEEKYKRRDKERDRPSRHRNNRDKDRGRPYDGDRNRRRERGHREDERGPRYKGGYHR